MESAALWRRWAEVVGEDIAAHAEPTSLRDGVLRIRTESPAWATELGYLADEIKRRADEVVGRGVVREVRVWTGPGPIKRPASSPERASPAVRNDPPADAMEALRRAYRAWSRRRSARR
jgi:predicted nucleic acid-binding Zn ribbon protein